VEEKPQNSFRRSQGHCKLIRFSTGTSSWPLPRQSATAQISINESLSELGTDTHEATSSRDPRATRLSGYMMLTWKATPHTQGRLKVALDLKT